MAQYIIEMDSSVHADTTAAQSAITSAGGTITKTYSFPFTYKVECETSEYDAISGKKIRRINRYCQNIYAFI